MSRCHWIHDKKAGKVWIPGCYQGIYSEGYCGCRQWDKEQMCKRPNEAKEYNKLNERLLKENNRLIKIIERLTKKR